jgi:hypothetical protein
MICWRIQLILFVQVYLFVVNSCKASVSIAAHTLERNPWNEELTKISKIDSENPELRVWNIIYLTFQKCIVQLYNFYLKEISSIDLNALKTKYSKPEYLKCATIIPPVNPPFYNNILCAAIIPSSNPQNAPEEIIKYVQLDG